MLDRILIQVKILYDAQHVGLTKKELEALEVMKMRAMRVITGLPIFTPISQLQAQAALNTIDDLLHEGCFGQQRRLSRPRPGLPFSPTPYHHSSR